MSDNIDQKAGDPVAPATSQDASKGTEPEVKVDGGKDSTAELENRLKGMQGTLQQQIEEKKRIADEKAALEAKLKEYEYEKLSEMEKLQLKLKEAEEALALSAKEKESLAVRSKWQADWNEIQREFPNASNLAIVKKKAETNPGALGDSEASDYDTWLSSVKAELAEMEETLGKPEGGNPAVKKIGNTNVSDPAAGDLYNGLSPEDKLKKLRENIGVKSGW